MPAIKLEQFGGMLPAWDPHLLPTGQASYAKNGYLFAGALIGWRKPKFLRDLLNSTARMVYRIPTFNESQAVAYLVFILPNVVHGDTVSVGDLTYRFVDSLEPFAVGDVVQTGEPFDVLIGLDSEESARNLAEALTADDDTNENSGVHYGENTPRNGDVKFYLPGTNDIPGLTDPQVTIETYNAADLPTLVIGAEDFGAAYNRIAVSESTGGVRIRWLSALDLGASTAVFSGGTNLTFDKEVTGPGTWLEFNDPDTNVFKSPVADDQFKRYYWASPSQMPEYNTYARIQDGEDAWLLGVPPPGCATTISVVGGGNDLLLGNITPSGGRLDGRANMIYVMKVHTPGATAIQNVTFTVNNTILTPTEGWPEAHFAAVIFTDNNDKPGNLLNTGSIVTGIQPDVEAVSPFVNPTNLEGDTDFWIGFMIDAAVYLEGGPAGGASNTSQWSNTFTNGPPAQAPSSSLGRTALVSDGTNVANGDKVIIGLVTYTFVTTLADPGNVQIGSTPADSLLHLSRAINGTGTAGVDYQAGTLASTQVTAAAPVGLSLELTAIDDTFDPQSVGTVFTPVGSPPHLTFDGPTLGPGYMSEQPGLNMWGVFITEDLIESRSYVYTWVSEYGEEGPPSPPSLLQGWSNGTWTIGLWQPPPNDQGVLRNLKKIRLYRTVSGKGGATVFFFVAEVDVGVESYTDTIPNDDVALNDQLASQTWFPPPANLQGFTVMQNGMVAGFVDNEIWFCEPYHPHAWPPGYSLTLDHTIVGLGVTGGALVACTAANPYVISGTAPASMSQVKCADANPCSSRASILSGDNSVSFMSPDGLIQVTAAGVATNTTDVWFTREQWRQLVSQKYTRAINLASSYFCLGSVSPDGTDTSEAQRGFTIQLAADNASFTIWPQPGGHRLGFQVLDAPLDGEDTMNVQTDSLTGVGLLVADGKVYYWDFGDAEPEHKVYTWKSKGYHQNVKRSYAAIKVYFSVPPGTPEQNEERIEADADDPVWNALPDDSYGFIKTYADTDGTGNFVLVDCREIRKNGELLRIVDGFKAEDWQWEIIARVYIDGVQVATSVKELGQI